MLKDGLALVALLAGLVGFAWAMTHALSLVVAQMNAAVDPSCFTAFDCARLAY